MSYSIYTWDGAKIKASSYLVRDGFVVFWEKENTPPVMYSCNFVLKIEPN